jgi:hypothetical protein
MRSSRLTLATVVLGIFIIGVSAPSAWASQEWLVDYRTLSELELEEEKFEVTSKVPTVISSAGLKLVLKCSTTKGSGKIFSNGTDEISLSLSNCEAEKLPACKPSEPVTVTAKSQVASTSNGFHEKFEQMSKATPLATMTFGKECALGETVQLTGAIAGKLPTKLSAERTIAMSEAFTKKLNEELTAGKLPEYTLFAGSKSAIMSGEFTTKLSGANAGKVVEAQPWTVICKSPPVGMGLQCPAGENWPENTVFKLETLEGEKVKWKSPANPTVTCEALRMEGPLGDRLSLGVFNSVSFGASCAGGCTVSAYSLPWIFFFIRIPKVLAIHSPHFKFDCGTGKICKYFAPFALSTVIQEGSPAKLEFTSLNLTLDSGDAWCSATSILENDAGGSTRFKFWEPAPLYVASP